MTERRPRVAGRNHAYDEVTYRESLRALGLFAPVALDDIHRAYRSRAKLVHPDRFAANGDLEEATRRLQALNAAHEYVLHHYPVFDRSQGRAWRRGTRPGDEEATAAPWQEWLLLPVTLLYGIATLIVAAPIMIAAVMVGRNLRARWHETRLAGAIAPLWEGWLVVGPHLLVLAGFLFADRISLEVPRVKLWLGASLLIMLSADLASRVTRDSNVLRMHRAIHRLHALVRGY